MNKDMHHFLERLEQEKPWDVFRVKKEVSPAFEIPAILHHVEGRRKNPVIIFEQVRNLNGDLSPMPVVINLFGSRARLADALDSTIERLPFDYIERERPVPPVVIGTAESRVKDTVQTGKAVDLFTIPFVTHHAMDLGPYISAGTCWIKDPDTGWTNCAILRIYVAGKRRLVVNFNPARHTNYIFQKYKRLGASIPMIVVIGHHPAFYLGAQTKHLLDEPTIIGGVMGEPLELTASETWGREVLVPAQAEIVIEAEMSTTEVDIEAPFGEYTQYYGGQRLNPVADVTAITCRRDALYLDIMPGHADHLLLDAPMIEAYLYSRIKAVVPGVRAVHMPVSGTARLHAYVQLKKANDAEPKTVIAAAVSSDYRVKHVIVVDEDVDIFNDAEVLWAVATRSQWDKDLVVIPGMMGTRLDPSGDDILTTKGGIDATKPFDVHTFPQRLSIPKPVLDRIRLEDYLDPETLR